MIGTIISSLMGFASGGWGSFAAIVALIGAGIFLYWKYKQAVREKAQNDTKDKSAEDQAAIIKDNQKQAEQIKIDEAANAKALAEAQKKIEAAALAQQVHRVPVESP